MSDDLLDVFSQALHAATGAQIDVGEAPDEEVITHVHDVGAGEEYHAIAVGVAAGKVHDFDFLAIEMHG